MLPCTKISNVENLSSTPYYWSETVSIRIELSFDTSASDDFKTLLLAQHHDQDDDNNNDNESSYSSSNQKIEASAACAWTRAIREKLSQAAVASTQVRQSPTSTNFTNSFALERPTFASTSHPSSQRQYIDDGSNNIHFGFKDEDPQQPTASFILNLAIPYSCNISSSMTMTSGSNQSTTDINNNNNSSDGGISSSKQDQQQQLYSFCEWEIVLLTKERVGPSRSQMTHFSPFAVMRHAVPVSSAVSISAQVVPCCEKIGRNHNNNKNYNQNSEQQHQQQQRPSCLVTVTCKNTCDNRVILRHVELESPNNWSPAFVKDYTSIIMNNNDSNNNSAISNQYSPAFASSPFAASATTLSVADPWIVRRRTDGQKQFLYYYENQLNDIMMTNNNSGGQKRRNNYNNNNSSNGSPDLGRSLTIQAPVMNLRTSVQNLITLSDSFPITLKPSESYTFCFECYGWDFVEQRMIVALRNHHTSNNNSNSSKKNGGMQQQTDDGSISNNTTNGPASASSVLAKSLVSLFIARTTVSGRPVLLNHPVKV